MTPWKPWPYGTSGNSQLFKQNAILLTADVSAAADQEGKTVIRLSAELMSADLPAPPGIRETQYADHNKTLAFDSAASVEEIAEFYREALGKTGCKPTTAKPTRVDLKQVLVFTNSQNDRLTLEMQPVDDNLQVRLAHQTASEIAALNPRSSDRQGSATVTATGTQPVVSVALPADAATITEGKARIEFTVAKGKGKETVESLRRRFVDDGWKEAAADMKSLFGTFSLARDKQQLKIDFVDSGTGPAEITISVKRGELERAK
ncbi:MAG: hypothetical protein EXS05_22250 [Planctomycetaceae bacterium]|nr:hypothetical protein [Planctomycetaceae bacterium]